MTVKHFAQKSSLYLYTDYVIAIGAENEVAAMVKKHKGSKVIIVYAGSAKRCGLVDQVCGKLNEAGISAIVAPQAISANAPRSEVEHLTEAAKQAEVDFFLALGGGSVVDAAKAAAMGVCYEGPVWDIYAGKVRPDRSLPVGAIPTISAAGSESSRASVIFDDLDTHRKIGFGAPFCRPVFCLMNPELTYSVNELQTACGACDAMGHTFNRFFFRDACALADEFASGQMRTVIKYAKRAVANPRDYEARRELALCAAFGHNDLTELGRGGAHGGAHDLFAFLTVNYGAPHGLAVAMGFAPWIEWIVSTGEEEAVARAAKFAVDVFGVPCDYDDLPSTALLGAQRIRDFVRSLGLPVTVSEYFAMAHIDADPQQLDMDECVRHSGISADGFIHGYSDQSASEVATLIRESL